MTMPVKTSKSAKLGIPKRPFMSGERVKVSFRMPKDMETALKSLAKEKAMDVSDLVFTMLGNALQDELGK